MEIKYFVRRPHGVHLNHAYIPKKVCKLPKCKNNDQYTNIINKTK